MQHRGEAWADRFWPPGWGIESASSPLMDFGGLNDNRIKSLINLLSVKQEIEFIAYTYGLWNEK